MKILFVHQNFPGQYKYILNALALEKQHVLVGLGIQPLKATLPQGVIYKQYAPIQKNTTGLHSLLLETETKVIRGEACARAALTLRNGGFQPDLICAHPGWGESLFLKDIWPNAPILSYQEFWYKSKGLDYNFDPEFEKSLCWQESSHIRMKNATNHLAFEASSWNITPTRFQLDSFPDIWKKSITQIHDGIDTDIAKPASDEVSLSLSNGFHANTSQTIITYVNRAIEPYRGAHTLIRSIPRLQQLKPEAEIVIVGDPCAGGYGRKPLKGTWAEIFLKEIQGQYNPSKVHFVGTIPHDQFIKLMQISSVHIYLTYPFVLSWSLLEAMSCGCAIVASKTMPVEEVIKHNYNGILVDFFEHNALAEVTAELLENKPFAEDLGKNARQTIIQHYCLKNCLSMHRQLMNDVANGKIRT